MILTQQELYRPAELPREHDRAVAARVFTFFCWMAAFWFFITPVVFFGVSEQGESWNSWVVGGLMMLVCLARMLAPLRTAAASWVNIVLAV